jgi:hypothetical protein
MTNGPGKSDRPAVPVRSRVGWLWHRSLSRRSQNGRVLWDRMRRHITQWLAFAFHLSSLSSAAHGRYYLRPRAGCGKAARQDPSRVMSNRDPYPD